MRFATTIWLATMTIAAVDASANSARVSNADTPAASAEKAEAKIWFERALHSQAEFNVAAMLDSGRGAPRNVAQASIWYARAAAAGNSRAAFNLGQLYESGEGVPTNADLARAWYAAAGLRAAQERLAEVKPPADRPASVRAPEPLFPAKANALEPDSQKVDLVWTSFIEPEVVRYFVELRLLDAGASREVGVGLST
jgi:hypothetical protein